MVDDDAMNTRFWIGLLAVLVIGAGSVVAALLVYDHDQNEFHLRQREEAIRAAHQAETVSAISVGEIPSAAAFIKADGNLTKHEFAVVGHALVNERVLHAAAYIAVVHSDERTRYEREQGFPIVERGPNGKLVRARTRSIYYPLTYLVATNPSLNLRSLHRSLVNPALVLVTCPDGSNGPRGTRTIRVPHPTGGLSEQRSGQVDDPSMYGCRLRRGHARVPVRPARPPRVDRSAH